jgi:hypothetical protein
MAVHCEKFSIFIARRGFIFFQERLSQASKKINCPSRRQATPNAISSSSRASTARALEATPYRDTTVPNRDGVIVLASNNGVTTRRTAASIREFTRGSCALSIRIRIYRHEAATPYPGSHVHEHSDFKILIGLIIFFLI